MFQIIYKHLYSTVRFDTAYDETECREGREYFKVLNVENF